MAEKKPKAKPNVPGPSLFQQLGSGINEAIGITPANGAESTGNRLRPSGTSVAGGLLDSLMPGQAPEQPQPEYGRSMMPPGVNPMPPEMQRSAMPPNAPPQPLRPQMNALPPQAPPAPHGDNLGIGVLRWLTGMLNGTPAMGPAPIRGLTPTNAVRG